MEWTDIVIALAAVATAGWAGSTFSWVRSSAIQSLETNLADRRRELLIAHQGFEVRRLSNCRQIQRIAVEAYLSVLDTFAGRILRMWFGQSRYRARYATHIQEGLAWIERYRKVPKGKAVGRLRQTFPHIERLAKKWNIKASFDVDLLPPMDEGTEEE